MARKKNKPKPNKSQPQNLLQQKGQGVQSLTTTAQAFAGPLPPPQILEKYNNIVTGAADRIIAMAENQAKHRHQLELEVINSEIKNSRTGLHYGLIIGLSSIIGGVVCILLGHQIGGSIIGGSGITGLVSVFVYGSRERRKERERRFKKLTGN